MARADEAIFLWINGGVGRLPALDRLAEWLVSDYLVSSILGFSLLLLWFSGASEDDRLRRQLGVLVSLLGMALASWAVFVSNAIFFRDRPFVDLDVSLLFYQPTDPSMPANSAAAFFGLAAGVWGFNRRAGTALLAIAGAHAFLRIYAGVHYPSDVLVGALIGVVGAVGAYKLWGLLGPLPTMAIKAARILCLA
ncbi:MAG: phosphatase PAP2 family protein [Candidatus Brocadiia bacterium]|jgi:undecaprenyl-diphosphatase|nr:phosphatase PAP2 family protein [Candidatus Brocadiia bacterium]